MRWTEFARRMALAAVLLTPLLATAQDTSPEAAPQETSTTAAASNPVVEVVPEAEVTPPRIPDQFTLMMMVEQGGVILWVIMGLGFIALVMALYLIFTLTARREIPPTLMKRAHSQVADGDFRGAYQMCMDRDELMAHVLAAGLKMAGHDRYVVQEAMESEGERGATILRQRISYLNNIAQIAPLLGLLGTVWGMMQAMGSIAMDTSQVKGMTMAYSVGTAMITTAAGLVLAIPTLAIYFYLRGRVIKIVAEVEAQATEFVELIMRNR